MTRDIEDTVKQVKACRSWSGVLVVTVVMRPDKFSCPNDCHMCPKEPGQPRSYLSTEPAVARANKNEFDAVKQFDSRMNMLHNNGHTLDKIEIIVLGGTFSSYPRDYQEEFVRDLFYAANTYTHQESHTARREPKGIQYEKAKNETAHKKIIGISLETRPDHINKYELRRFRRLGCTRIQIGVQHTDNYLLEIINRGHTVEQSIHAIQLIKQAGFKLDVHIMPDLPGATPNGDKEMIRTVLTDERFVPDYLKLYPCLDVDFTEIREWKKSGQWEPYAETNKGQTLLDVCLVAKEYSKEFIRYNRIQRDFPEEKPDLVGYSSTYIRNNFRQMLQNYAKKHGITCLCIRCREVKNKKIEPQRIKHTEYASSGGGEHFISITNGRDTTLYGFIRLRLQRESIFSELNGIALIRELHVYGFLQTTAKGAAKSNRSQIQHRGLGKALLASAENAAYRSGFYTVAVISGVGVREYYRKQGYELRFSTEYMCKRLSAWTCLTNAWTIIVFKVQNIIWICGEMLRKRSQKRCAR
jgi:ELP3 family radical SAM enzyme/protein acetyltransferase